ncbi:unnamed protein product [Mytilus edulis]|uniref:Uncharacterized protein n=1 Tax=Mytilus edulis TaxID=6550 RepID=A0A8S3UB89_MYTED|nr:unnamed protein product [Mytilus edulis]
MATEDNERCARCCMVVLDVFNAMMQDLMQHQPIPAPVLYQMIMRDNYFRKHKLNSDEIHTIQTLQSEDFRILIPRPTRNWGSKPLPQEVDIGDDVERIRRKRNSFVHQISAKKSEEGMNKFFIASLEIGKRIDKYLNKTDQGGHEQTIKRFQSCSMERRTADKYIEDTKKIESLEETMMVQVDGIKMHFYEGKSIANLAAMVKDCVDGEHMTPVQIIFHGVKDPDQQTELLNRLGSQKLSTADIKFISATQSCIAVSVLIRNTVLVNSRRLLTEVDNFVQKIVSSTGMMFFLEKDLNIVVVSSEGKLLKLEFISNEIVLMIFNPFSHIDLLIFSL